MMIVLSGAAASTIVSAAAYFIYREYFEKLPWVSLDAGFSARKTLAWLSDAEQTAIYSRGTLIRRRWRVIYRRVARQIDESLGTINGRGPTTMDKLP